MRAWLTTTDYCAFCIRKDGYSPHPPNRTRVRPVDIHTRGPTVLVMGDKSPKANKKQATQKNAKNDASQQKKKAATAAKQIPKGKK
jgi:hypothetical protein